MFGLKKQFKVVGTAALIGASMSATSPAMADLPAVVFEEGQLVSLSDAASIYGADTTASTTKDKFNNDMDTASLLEIQELAAGLGAKEVIDGILAQASYETRVWRYIRNNIRTDFTFGSKKGAYGTLIDRSGTPFDQAALMIALLEEADIDGDYVLGTLNLTADQFAEWTGFVKRTPLASPFNPAVMTDYAVSATAACQFLANGGIPGEVNNESKSACGYGTSEATSVKMWHVWVKVGNREYDPAFKEYILKKQLDIPAMMGCTDKVTCADGAETAAMTGATKTSAGATIQKVSNVQNVPLFAKLSDYAEALETTMLAASTRRFADIEDITGGMVIDLSATEEADPAPVSSTALRTWTGDIPDVFRTKVTFKIDEINKSFWADEISGKRIRLIGRNRDAVAGETYVAPRYMGLYVEYQLFALSKGSLTVPSRMKKTDNFNYDWNPLEIKVEHPYLYKDSGGVVQSDFMDRTIERTIQTWPQWLDGNEANYWNFKPITLVFSTGSVSPEALATFTQRQADSHTRYVVPSAAEPDATLALAYDDIYDCGRPSSGSFALKNWVNIKNYGTLKVNRRCTVLGDPTYVENYLVQDSALQDLVANMQNAHVQTHHIIGFKADESISTEASRTVTSADDSEAKRKGAITAGTLLSNWLEGGITAQATSANGRFSPIDGFYAVNAWESDGDEGEFIFVTQSNVNSVISSLTWAYDADEKLVVENRIRDYANMGASMIMATDTSFLDAMYVRTPNLDRIAVVTRTGYKGSDGVPEMASEQKKDQAVDTATFSASLNAADASLNTGAIVDIVTGSGDFPNALAFSRQYSSNLGYTQLLRETEEQGQYNEMLSTGQLGTYLGGGWKHNYEIVARLASDGVTAMGRDKAIDAINMMAGLSVLSGIGESTQTFHRDLTAIFATRWLGSRTIHNIVEVKGVPGASGAYTKTPSGKYVAPKRVTSILNGGIAWWGGETNSWMTNNVGSYPVSFHDIRFDLQTIGGSKIYFVPETLAYFDAIPTSGVSTGTKEFAPKLWVFPSGGYLQFDYDYNPWNYVTDPEPTGLTNCLTKVTNHFGRSLEFSYVADGHGAFRTCSLTSVTDDAGRRVAYTSTVGTTTTDGWALTGKDDRVLKAELRNEIGASDGSVSAYYYDFRNGNSKGYGPIDWRMTKLEIQTTSGGPQYHQTFEFDDSLRLTTVKDMRSNATSLRLGGLGGEQEKIAVVTDAVGNQSETVFNKFNQPTQVTDPTGRVTARTYDNQGWLEKEEMPGGMSVELVTDRYGNVLSKSVVSKDGLSRRTVNATYAAVPATLPLNMGATNIYNLPSTATDPKGRVTKYCYAASATDTDCTTGNTKGLVSKVLQPTVGGVRPTSKYWYNSFGQVTLTSTPEQIKTSSEYDSYGNLTSVTVDSTGEALKTVYFYDKVGNVCRTVGPRGSAGLTGGYDNRCGLTTQSGTGGTGGGGGNSGGSGQQQH